MTDYLSERPARAMADFAPGEREYNEQGGEQHKFWAKNPADFYSQVNVYQYESNYRSLRSAHNMIGEFEESLKEALSQNEISRDTAQVFADIFNISLKRSFEFIATVEFSFTVELGLDDDPDTMTDNLNFEISEAWGADYELDNVDASVTYSNYTEV